MSLLTKKYSILRLYKLDELYNFMNSPLVSVLITTKNEEKNAAKSLGRHFFKADTTKIDTEKDKVNLNDSAVNL